MMTSSVMAATFAILMRIISFLLEQFYRWFPPDAFPVSVVILYQSLFILVGIYLLIFLISFIAIMYRLIKNKKWQFMKGFLVGAVLLPLTLIGIFWGLMVLSV